jgi:hypothetical protein
MTRKRNETAAAKPAVTLPGNVTEQDRAIVARREAGETRKAICEALGVGVSRVYHAEYVCRRDADGRAMLAKCPDSIRGLETIGELDSKAAHAFAWHCHNHDGPSPERMSDVAALGRAYVSRMNGIGPKSLASIDRVLGLLGIAWSPIDRTPKPLPPVQQQEAERRPAMSDGSAWSDIVRRVGEIERAVGTAVLENDPQRNSIDCVALRLSFLTGYIEGHFERRAHKPMRDITPEADSGEDLEIAGNLICLPGVKLVDVLPQHDGGQP